MNLKMSLSCLSGFCSWICWVAAWSEEYDVACMSKQENEIGESFPLNPWSCQLLIWCTFTYWSHPLFNYGALYMDHLELLDKLHSLNNYDTIVNKKLVWVWVQGFRTLTMPTQKNWNIIVIRNIYVKFGGLNKK
jgi:hypothetical protein